MKNSLIHGLGLAILERIFAKIALLTAERSAAVFGEILMFDPRQINADTIPWFVKTLKILKANYKIVPLDNSAGFGAKNTVAVMLAVPSRSIFDNLAPIFREHQIPFSVTLPTSFIGTNNLLWEDKVRSILSKVRDRSTLPQNVQMIFEEIQDELSVERRRDGIITDTEIDALILLLKKIQPNLRISFLGDVVSYGEAGNLLSNERTMLNWEEVRKLYSDGVQFISANHGFLDLSEVGFDEALSSVKKSAISFNENQVVPISALYFPGDELPHYWEELLRALQLNSGIGGKKMIDIGDIRVLAPIEIGPDNSPAASVLVCRVMRRTFIGYEF